MDARSSISRCSEVPFDLFAQEPVEIKKLKTWAGCCFSVITVALVLGSFTSVAYNFFTSSYDLSEAQVPNDADLSVNPTSGLLPKIGVIYSTDSEQIFPNGSIVDIKYYIVAEELMKDSYGEGRIEIGTEECAFFEDSDRIPIISLLCPTWGRVRGRILDNGTAAYEFFPSDEEPNVPIIQGLPLDPFFGTLVAEVLVNLTNLSQQSELTLQDIFDGQVHSAVVTEEYNLKGVTVLDDMKNRLGKKRYTNSASLKALALRIVQWKFAVRTIERANFMLDFTLFEEDFQDLTVVQTEEKEDDSNLLQRLWLLNQTMGASQINASELPESLLLATVEFSMANQFLSVQMSPSATFAGIMGTLGGIMSLFIFAVGIPAVFINRKIFKRAVKRAKRKGLLQEQMLAGNGRIKLDSANEAVEVLTRVSTLSPLSTKHLGARRPPNRGGEKSVGPRSADARLDIINGAESTD